MNKLEWLARNVSEWNNCYSHCCVNAIEGFQIESNSFHWSNTGLGNGRGAVPFTKSQWLAERVRLGLDKPEWDGLGFPPVGIACNVLIAGVWKECVVVADHFKGGVIVQWQGITPDLRHVMVESHLTAIRTEEEKAIDELANLIEGWTDRPELGEEFTDIASILYKKGYRKQEQE